MSKAAKAVVEEIQEKDILSRHAAFEQAPDDLEQERRFSAAPYAHAYGGLAGHGFYVDAPGDSGIVFGFLAIEDDLLQRIEHEGMRL